MGLTSSTVENEVFVVGVNYYGQLGIGHKDNINSLISWNRHQKLQKKNEIKLKSINSGHSFTITYN